MDMKFARWVALVIGLCTAIAIATVTIPLGGIRQPATPDQRRLDMERARLRSSSAAVDRALARYRGMVGAERWRTMTAHDVRTAVVDASLPPAARRTLESTMQGAGEPLARGPIGASAVAFLDTAVVTLQKGADRRPYRAEVTYLLPASPDGVCGAATRMRRADATLSAGEVYGPCAFFAAFGMPGHGIRDWMERTEYDAARWADWTSTSATSAGRDGSWYALPGDDARCAVRGGSACLTMIGLDPVAAGVASSRSDDGILGPFETHDSLWTPTASVLKRRLLADMVRQFDRDRFRVFWTSEDAPAAAFERATGMPLETWARAWLTGHVVRPVTRAGVSFSAFAWFVAALPLLLFAAVRPRDAVRRDAR
jgi:hypothetical protein